MEDRKKKSVSGLAWLVPVLLFLGAGGFLAWFSMKNAAEKLAGRPSESSLYSSGLYAGKGGGIAAREFFSSEEDLTPEALAAHEAYGLQEEPATQRRVPGRRPGGEGAGALSSDGGDPAGENTGFQSRTAAVLSGGGPAPRLSAGLSPHGGGPAGAAKSSLGQSQVSSGGRQGAPAVLSTGGPGAARGGRTGGGGVSVLESLRSAWRGSLMGARDASNDSARALLARSFDGSPSHERLSLVYDEKMKRDLDIVSPSSIPNFLRDQDISADRASKYSPPEIGAVSVDREGTEAALAEDKDYQAKKAAQDLASGMLNPMFGGLTSGMGGDADGAEDPGVLSNPGDQAWLNALQEQEWMDMGVTDCGCDPSTCCCLPPGYFDDGLIGDFPAPGAGGTMFG